MFSAFCAFSLRNLCALCGSAVNVFFYRRAAEDAEITQS